MIIGIYYKNIAIPSRIEYTIRFINDHPHCPTDVRVLANPDNADIVINYGERDGIFIPFQNVFFAGNNLSNAISNSYGFEALNIHSIENVKNKAIIPFFDSHFSFDILETIFFHISRIEEYDCPSSKKTKWDSMRSEEMFLVRNELEKKPIVDHIVYAFFKSLGIQIPIQTTKKFISHDIDHIRKYTSDISPYRKLLGHLRRGEFSSISKWKQQIESFRNGGKDPYNTFEWMLSEKGGHVYYLIGGQTKYDSPIPITDSIFESSIVLAKERGYKIGIHPSYNAWIDAEMAKGEKMKLEEKIGADIEISRQHYLHFDFPRTLNLLEKIGIKEDSSLGFYDRIGFRCGTGFPFRLYDIKREQEVELIERPLVFMDSALIREVKKTGDMNQMIRVTNSFIEDTKYFTHITANFHNSRFDESEMMGWTLRDVYGKFLV